MEMVGKINGNEFTCNNSFINEYLKFLNNIPKTPDILISSQDSETQESVNNIIDLEPDYKLDNNKNIKLNLPKYENIEINTQEIVNNILDLEADYKLDNNKNIELKLPIHPILNTEIRGTLKETKKRVLENFESSLDDLPLSELSAILRNEETYSVEGLNFEFITEEEAKMKGLYYLNDPITIMEGYFPPPKKVKKHKIPTGNDYLELFQHYPSCSMDTNKSTRPSVRMDRYGIGCDIDMSVSDDVSLEIRGEAADSYKKIINLYPQENMKRP
ncbi:uncharacterized protein LOC125062630 [Pieris napi]|uniref:uncharacterized protein LOC125062630 n=1 Tax=Pieris napi TaxID=78633 RepID=UPI001FB99659|nr:uncharacterized protein LOC125062630 [Pieris napi]